MVYYIITSIQNSYLKKIFVATKRINKQRDTDHAIVYLISFTWRPGKKKKINKTFEMKHINRTERWREINSEHAVFRQRTDILSASPYDSVWIIGKAVGLLEN